LSSMDTKMLALIVIFGAMAVVLSFVHIPFPPFGDVTPASTPVSIVSTIAPSVVGVGVSLIKGVGISMWTGKWFMELPVGIGDAFMAAFTYYLVKKKIKPTYAVIAGQLSRYLFTSGMVALYISTIVSTGIPSPLGGDVIAKFTSYAGKVGANPSYNTFLSSMSIVWLARVPSMTLSILVNAFLSVLVIRSAGKQLKKFAKYFVKENEEK
jgi:thiamine transporter ThiT